MIPAASKAKNIPMAFFEMIRYLIEFANQKKVLILLPEKGSGKETVAYSAKDCLDFVTYSAFGLSSRPLDIQRHERVCLLPFNLPESYFTMIGLNAIGAIPVPLNLPLLSRPDDLRRIIEHSGSRFLLGPKFLASGPFSDLVAKYNFRSFEEILETGQKQAAGREEYIAELLESMFKNFNENSIAVIPYTSGTTSEDGSSLKGVALSHKNILERTTALSEALNITPDERLISYLPWGHIAELVATFYGQIVNGYSVYFTEAIKYLPDVEKFRKHLPYAILQTQPTIFIGVPKIWENFQKGIVEKTNQSVFLSNTQYFTPFAYKYLLRKKLGFEEARILITSAASCPESVFKFFSDLNMPLTDIYGLSEIAGPLTINGKVIGDAEVKIAEEDEIVIRGNCVMNSYFEDIEATKRVLKNGWFYTGDLGKIEDGKLVIEGRLNEVIKTSHGEKINVGSIEKRLKKLSGVEEVIVTGGKDNNYLVALVFTSENLLNSREFKNKVSAYIQGFVNATEVTGLTKVRNFTILSISEISIQKGTVTDTMKIKRNIVKQKFKEIVENLDPAL